MRRRKKFHTFVRRADITDPRAADSAAIPAIRADSAAAIPADSEVKGLASKPEATGEERAEENTASELDSLFFSERI